MSEGSLPTFFGMLLYFQTIWVAHLASAAAIFLLIILPIAVVGETLLHMCSLKYILLIYKHLYIWTLLANVAFDFLKRFRYLLTVVGLCCCMWAFSSCGFLLPWLLMLWNTGSRCLGFSSCSVWAQKLPHPGLVVPQHMGSSRTSDQTCSLLCKADS